MSNIGLFEFCDDVSPRTEKIPSHTSKTGAIRLIKTIVDQVDSEIQMIIGIPDLRHHGFPDDYSETL